MRLLIQSEETRVKLKRKTRNGRKNVRDFPEVVNNSEYCALLDKRRHSSEQGMILYTSCVEVRACLNKRWHSSYTRNTIIHILGWSWGMFGSMKSQGETMQPHELRFDLDNFGVGFSFTSIWIQGFVRFHCKDGSPTLPHQQILWFGFHSFR